MGGTSWSDDAYVSRSAMRASEGIETFDYHKKVSTGKAAAAPHVKMDPSKMNAGARECRDSDAHPTSNAIYLGLDVTGSMSGVPRLFQQKLKELLALLLKKDYITDPAICVSAIGDANYDSAPFQLGQFESGIEIEDDLTNLYLEGGGGGNSYESYDLALYFLARCTKTDCFEKRGKKGYAFIICDEGLPKFCDRKLVKKVFNHEVQDILVADLFKEVLAKWELFCIVPSGTNHYKTRMQDAWKEQLGQRVIYLDEPDKVVETIAACIGLSEDSVDSDGLVADLVDVGLSEKSAKVVTKALAKVEGGIAVKTKGTGLATL
jgi:hypothetical protein